MPFMMPTILALVISLTVLNTAFSNNFFVSDEFPLREKLVGIAQADAETEGGRDIPKNLNKIFSRAFGNIQDTAGIPARVARETLPISGGYKEPEKKEGAADLDISCQSGAAIDLKSGKLLYSKNSGEKYSIASISKLMAALVFLDKNPGWEKVYEVQPGDMREGGENHLSPGEKAYVKDLFYSSLVASDNSATIALIKSTGMSEKEFVDKMNEKAGNLDLMDTHFTDPLGLVDENKSTAVEVAKFAQAALSNEEIRKATLTKKYDFRTLGGRDVTVNNTDNLLSVFPKNGVQIKGGKTGYTEAAGYCFVGAFTDFQGHDVISVVLGTPDKEARFDMTHAMVEWIFQAFKW